MSAADLLLHLRTSGFSVTAPDGGGIRVVPGIDLSDDQRQAIRDHKSALLALLAADQPCEVLETSPSDCGGDATTANADSTKLGATAMMDVSGKKAANKTKKNAGTKPGPTKAPEPTGQSAEALELAELKEQIAELSANLKDALDDNNSMGAVFDADDHLAAAVAEIKKLQAQVRLLTERSNGLLNEKDVAVRHATSAQRKLEKVARELDAHQAIQQPVASHASAVLTVKPRTTNTQTCASCQHLTLRKTCTEPAAAGLDPPPGLPAGADWFGIRWPPQGYGATCASYSTKPTTLATTPAGAATPLRDNAECSQLQGVIKQ